MRKINWAEKLSSRKFILAVIGFVTSILYAFNVAEVTVEKVTSVISALGLLITYILVEGNIDANSIDAKKE